MPSDNLRVIESKPAEPDETDLRADLDGLGGGVDSLLSLSCVISIIPLSCARIGWSWSESEMSITSSLTCGALPLPATG